MSWRNNPGSSGANTIPLGPRRRFGGDDEAPVGEVPRDAKRGRSPEPRPREPELNPDGSKKRRKAYRWGGDASDNKAGGLMNLPFAITGNMTMEQKDAYVLHVRVEEISQKLRINDVVPADGNRSPSPAPQYDNMGRRINTREYRYRKKLEDERHKLVEKAIKIIPTYHPPSDYRRPTKTQEKVYVPVNDYPEINFIGLLIGPRGNTLKKMENESGAKIAIRGKGSVKEGKGKSDAAHASNQDEDLHCLIMADTEDKINKAKELIHQVIETAASVPEGQNNLKRNQLRELAALNGTLRDDENQACQNCGEIGHRKYDCPNKTNYTASVICRNCGNAGHFARDCTERPRGTDWRNMPARAPAIGGFDSEVNNLMKDLGAGDSTANPSRQIGYDGGAAQDAPRASAGGASDPTAPWLARGQQQAGGATYGGQDDYGDQGNYSGQYNQGAYDAPAGGAAPWAGNQSYTRDGYGGYNDSYNGGDNYGNAGGYNGGDNYGNGGGYGQGRYGGVPPPGGDYGGRYDAPPPPPPGGGSYGGRYDGVPPPPPPSGGGYGGRYDGAPPPPPPPRSDYPPPPPPPPSSVPPPPPPRGVPPPPPPPRA